MGHGSLQEWELKGREEGRTCRKQAGCGFLSIASPSWNPLCVVELVVPHPPLQNLCLWDALSDPTGRGAHTEPEAEEQPSWGALLWGRSGQARALAAQGCRSQPPSPSVLGGGSS